MPDGDVDEIMPDQSRTTYGTVDVLLVRLANAFWPQKPNLSGQQPVILAHPYNQIFLMHLHCIITIFTYIYNDLLV